MDSVLARSRRDLHVANPFFKRPLIGERKVLSVEMVDGVDQRGIGPVIDGHHRGAEGLTGEIPITGKVGAAEPVNALLGVADDEERNGVAMVEDRRQDVDLGKIAVLTFVQDSGTEPCADCGGEFSIGSVCGVEGVADVSDKVVEGADCGGLACRVEPGPEILRHVQCSGTLPDLADFEELLPEFGAMIPQDPALCGGQFVGRVSGFKCGEAFPEFGEGTGVPAFFEGRPDMCDECAREVFEIGIAAWIPSEEPCIWVLDGSLCGARKGLDVDRCIQVRESEEFVMEEGEQVCRGILNHRLAGVGPEFHGVPCKEPLAETVECRDWREVKAAECGGESFSDRMGRFLGVVDMLVEDARFRRISGD